MALEGIVLTDNFEIRNLSLVLPVVSVVSDIKCFSRYYSIIQWLTRQGMKVFSLHQNVYCEQCLEMSFINTRLSQEYNSTFRRDVFAW